MDPADRLELHELPGRYGDAIDDRAWDRLDDIFTTDAVFDLTDLGAPRCEGLAAIKQFMDQEAQHPRTHLMTNIYVDESAHRRAAEIQDRRTPGRGQGRHCLVLRRRHQDPRRLARQQPRDHHASATLNRIGENSYLTHARTRPSERGRMRADGNLNPPLSETPIPAGLKAD